MKERFKFMGFEPDDHLRVFAQKSLDRIFSTAPSDATPTAFIEKTTDGFNGSIEVNSNHGTFSAEAQASNADKVVEKLNSEIKSQLEAWKKIRFL